MNKLIHLVLFALALLLLSCKDDYKFNNPLDSEANVTLQAPKNLQIVSMTVTQVTLTWEDTNIKPDYPNVRTEFVIEKSTNGNSFSIFKNVDAGITFTTIIGTYDSTTTYYFRVQAKTSINISGYSNIVSRKMSSPISTDMVLVQGGTFQMGSTAGESDEQPIHSVTVSSFYMDKYEVAYEKWTEVYNWAINHGYTDLTAGKNGFNPNGSNNPITNISWYDILKWCNARSEKDGLTPIYYTDNTQATVYRTGEISLSADAVKWTANGYRLPTEAEWEFAAHGGNSTHRYTYSGSNAINDVAWYCYNSGYTTHAVGTKTANDLGIYDMTGNVWEWCWDWYETYPGTSQSDPKGAISGTYRVLRGGSFEDYGCRIAVRGFGYPDSRWIGYGFRCSRD